MKNHILTALAFAAALATNAFAYTWTGDAGDGILNTPENWSPVLPGTPIDARWTTLAIGLPADGAAAAFTLTAPLSANYITISGGAADGAPAVFDLGGNFLYATNTAGTTTFSAATPLVLRNGVFLSYSTTAFGVNGDKASPVNMTIDGAALAGGWGTYYTTNLFVSVKDGGLTNALSSVPSHSRIVLDNSRVYVSSNGTVSPTEPGASSSNVTVRAVNGTTFVSGHTNRRFTINGNRNRYALLSQARMGIPTIVKGRDNRLGVTNATLATYMTIQGTNNVVDFSSAVACTPGFKNCTFSVAGLGNRLVFGDSAVTNDETSISQGLASTIGGSSNLVALNGSPSSYFNGAISFSGTGSGNALSIADYTVTARPLTVGGRDNMVGVTNAALASAMTITGTNNAVVFKSAVSCYPGFKSRNFGIGGLGNRLVFEDSAVTNDETSITQGLANTIGGSSNLVAITGSSASLLLSAITISGTGNVLSIADNLAVSNGLNTSAKMYGLPFAPTLSAGSVGCSLLVGTNAVAEFFAFDMSRLATNALFKVGRGSHVTSVKDAYNKASTVLGGLGDIGGRIVLDDATFDFFQGQYPLVVTGGVAVVLSGDSTRFFVSSKNPYSVSYGAMHITSVAEGLPHPRLVFRPGSTGFGGEAPISVRAPGYSRIDPDVVIDVDATEFSRRKPSGTYDIPLVKQARTWGRCDAEALTAAGVFTPANGRLAFNDDGDLVFRFKRDCGTRLTLR